MFTVLVFILFFGALQALLLLGVVLLRKKVQSFHIFLSAYIIVLLLQVGFKALSKVWLMHNVVEWYRLSYYLPFLYGPLALFFTRYYFTKAEWRIGHLLHFMPFCFYAVTVFLDGLHLNQPSILIIVTSPLARMVLQLISIAIYHYTLGQLINKVKSSAAKDKLSFIKTFTHLSFGITSAISFTLFFLYVNFPHYQDARWAFISLTLFIYWLSYKVLQHPALFKVIIGNATLNTQQAYTIPVLKAHVAPAKYSSSGLKQQEAERIMQALDKSMETGKLFLDCTLTMDILAEKIGCQKHHLSQVLNDNLQTSFATYINERRVEEAKRILAMPAFDHYKISSIAYDAGFNSLSSFNDIFKKSEGLTPSAYRVQSRVHQQAQIKRV